MMGPGAGMCSNRGPYARVHNTGFRWREGAHRDLVLLSLDLGLRGLDLPSFTREVSRSMTEGSREPGFHGEHVVLPVVEDRKGAQLAEMLCHQPRDRLIGIELRLRPEDENCGAEDDEAGEDARAHPPLARRARGGRREVLFGHAGQYHMLRISTRWWRPGRAGRRSG